MRLLVTLVILAGCKDTVPAPTPTPNREQPPLPAGDPRNLLGKEIVTSMRNTKRIDLPTTQEKLTLTGVTLLPMASQDADGTISHDVGVFVIEYMAAGTGAVRLRTQCRVGDKNLVTTHGTSIEVLKDEPTRFTSMFRPDPYKIATKVCELRFFYLTRKPPTFEDKPDDVLVATACYRDNAITEGACPPDAFPPPTFPQGFTATLEVQSWDTQQGSLAARLVATVGPPLADGHEYSVTARCETAVKKQLARGEDDAGFLELEALPAGASVEGPLGIFFDHSPDDGGRCELQLTSGKAGSKAKRSIHATYCLVDATTTTIRACDPPLGQKP